MQTFEQREIKFRAWDKELGMTNSFALHSSGLVAYLNNEWLVENQKPVLMQYTGLKDKNGKEIYEGDIVLILKSVHILEIVLEIVRYDTKNAGYSSLTGSCLDIEVIGNFFENEELIKWVGKCIVNINDLKRIGRI